MRPCVTAVTSPRCSPRTAAPPAPASTTARSRSSCRDASAAPGIRVVRGDTTGFAHTADLSEAGLLAAAEAAAAAARGTGGAAHTVALERRAVTPPHEVTILPETVAKVRKAEVLERADHAARAVGDSVRQVSASYADSRRRVLIANSDGLLVRGRPRAHALRGELRRGGRHRHADRQRSARPHGRLRDLRRDRPRGGGAHRGEPRAHDAAGPSGAERQVARRAQARCGWRVVPRGVRSRARGRPGGEGRVGVPRSAWASRSRRRSSR